MATDPDSFDRFRQRVLEDRDLQDTLLREDDPEAFCRLVVRLGRAHGYQFAEDDVRAALNTGHRAWLERMI